MAAVLYIELKSGSRRCRRRDQYHPLLVSVGLCVSGATSRRATGRAAEAEAEAVAAAF